MSWNEHRSLAFLEDPGLLLLICSKLVWGDCRTGDYTRCPDTELLAVGGAVLDMTGHIHTPNALRETEMHRIL